MAARKNVTAAQIINALRRAEVEIANGKRIKEVCRELGVSEQTGGRSVSPAWFTCGPTVLTITPAQGRWTNQRRPRWCPADS